MYNIDLTSMPPLDEEALKHFYVPEEEEENPSPSSAHPLPKSIANKRPTTKVTCFADNIQKTIESVAEKVEYARAHGGVLGIPSHLKQINKAFGGYQTGLHLVAGAPGVGKTAFLIQSAVHAAKEGYPVLINSFELAEEILSIQTLCQRDNLVPSTFRNGQATNEELNTFIESAQAQLFEEWTSNIFVIEGDAETTVADLYSIAQDLRERYEKPVLIMVDYIQRWARTQTFSVDARQNVSILSNVLREQIAKPLKSPVIAICNQNRSGTGKADMGSLKESGDLEYDADTVIIIGHDEKSDSTDKINRDIQFSCLKNRFGSQYVIKLNYRADTGKMTDAYDDFKENAPRSKRR